MKIADVEVGGYVAVPYVVEKGLRTPRVEGWHKVRVLEIRPHGRILVEEERWVFKRPTKAELKKYGGHIGWMLRGTKTTVADHKQYEVASRSCRPCSRSRVAA